jgi:rod shape-determining protein MreC
VVRSLKEFLSSKRFKILLCVFALLFGLMLHAALNADIAGIPQTIIKTVTRPFVSAATSISSWVDRRLDMLINADRYKRENETLRRQLSEMYAQIMDKDAIEEENERLKEILGIIEEREDFTLSPPSSVIAKEAVSVSGDFTINRGSRSGIKADDPVITDIGLVGVITETAPTYSKVKTILSTEIRIGVRTITGGAVGVIENDVLYSSNRQCLMRHIVMGSRIEVGDVVVTLGGSMYPAGLIVGTVVDVFPHENGLSLHAVIEPAEDIFRINDVFVITSFDGQGVMP